MYIYMWPYESINEQVQSSIGIEYSVLKGRRFPPSLYAGKALTLAEVTVHETSPRWALMMEL